MANELPIFREIFAEQYEIEAELGRGGMATVWLARDPKEDRRIALKVLRPDFAAAVGAERFRREIEIARTLTHPHILPVYESGEIRGRLFYAMPYISGENLRNRLERERQIRVDEAVRLAVEVAGALGFAHKHDILHRDIKPENILLQDGHAIVADFGIARVVGASAGAALTQTGMSVGTPTYMSPEQALADKGVDARTDQYALACVLYEMIAGQPPFVGATMQVLIVKHTMEPVPPLRTIVPAMTKPLEDVIFRALAKAPAERFATMEEFAAALKAPEAAATSAKAAAPRTAGWKKMVSGFFTRG